MHVLEVPDVSPCRQSGLFCRLTTDSEGVLQQLALLKLPWPFRKDCLFQRQKLQLLGCNQQHKSGVHSNDDHNDGCCA